MSGIDHICRCLCPQRRDVLPARIHRRGQSPPFPSSPHPPPPPQEPCACTVFILHSETKSRPKEMNLLTFHAVLGQTSGGQRWTTVDTAAAIPFAMPFSCPWPPLSPGLPFSRVNILLSSVSLLLLLLAFWHIVCHEPLPMFVWRPEAPMSSYAPWGALVLGRESFARTHNPTSHPWPNSAPAFHPFSRRLNTCWCCRSRIFHLNYP